MHTIIIATEEFLSSNIFMYLLLIPAAEVMLTNTYFYLIGRTGTIHKYILLHGLIVYMMLIRLLRVI